MVTYIPVDYEEKLLGNVLFRESIPAVLTFEVMPEGLMLLRYEMPRTDGNFQTDLKNAPPQPRWTVWMRSDTNCPIAEKRACCKFQHARFG